MSFSSVIIALCLIGMQKRIRQIALMTTLGFKKQLPCCRGCVIPPGKVAISAVFTLSTLAFTHPWKSAASAQNFQQKRSKIDLNLCQKGRYL